MRPSKLARCREMTGHFSIQAPWTRRHHRQRGHGPNGRRQLILPTMTISNKFGQPTAMCEVHGCANTRTVYSTDPNGHSPSTHASRARVGHKRIIRNPRFPKPNADGSPSRAIILIPCTKMVFSCVACAVAQKTFAANHYYPDGEPDETFDDLKKPRL